MVSVIRDIMNKKSQAVRLGFCLCILALGAMTAQGAQFFRISGPASASHPQHTLNIPSSHMVGNR